MANDTKELLSRIATTLLTEAYAGPQGRGSWFTEAEPEAGLLGTLARLSAEQASRPLTPGKEESAASHAEHLRFSFNLANRALRGENAYDHVDWKKSWEVTVVDETAWRALQDSLRAEYASMLEVLQNISIWDNEMNATGVMGTVAHSAWHLGVIRQALGLV